MRKRNWNKCVSLLMAAVMLMTLVMSTGITAAAVTAEVNAVDLTVSPDLMLTGAVYTDTVYNETSNVTVNVGNCTVDSIKWENNGGNLLTDGERLDGRQPYHIIITLKANDGEKFAQDATVAVNGEALSDNQYLNRYAHDDYNKLEIQYDYYPTVLDYIRSVDLTNAPTATLGNTADPYSYTHTVGGFAQYNATGAWYKYDASAREYKSMASTDTFKSDGSYQLTLRFEAKPGYMFDNPYLTVNGEWLNLDASDYFDCMKNLYFSFGAEITDVYLTIPNPVEGQEFSNTAPIKVTVSSGSAYTAEGNWRDEEGNLTGTFTKGKEYYFDCEIYANEGYHFARDVEAHINDSGFIWPTSSGKIASFSYRKSLKNHITEVVLNNVPKAELGKTLQAGDISIEVPADAKYQATASWWDEFQPLTSDQTVEAGKRYRLEIRLNADFEYEFAEQYILKINGIAHQRDGAYNNDIYMMEYSFLEQVNHIEITGVVAPVVGQSPSTDTLKSADPSKYEILFAQWLDAADGSFATEFENGHRYDLQVMVEAKSGFEFAPYATWKIDGETGVTAATTVPGFILYKSYSFETIIEEIKIDNIPSMKVGESAATVSVSVPTDANYTVEAEWLVWDDSIGRFQQFAGVFEQGKTYRLAIRAISNPGYRFETGTTDCYLDGVLREDVVIEEALAQAHCKIDFAQQNAKMIHRVEFNVKKPTSSEHSSIKPVITIPQNANYHQNPNGLLEWIVGDVQNPWPFFGYFEEGGSYGVSFDLVANEGYAFAEDLVVVVNGIILPTEAYTADSVKTLSGSYFFDMTCQHIFENGKCIVCEAADPSYVPETDTPADIPKTNDSSNVWLWFALLFASCTGILGITLNNRKKAKNK